MNVTKSGISLIILMSLSSCVLPETVISVGKAVDIVDVSKVDTSKVDGSIGGANEKKSDRKRESEKNDPINSKYSNRDFAGCFLNAMLVAPVYAIAEGIGNLLSFNPNPDVDINLSEEVIALIEKDLKDYIDREGKISPDDFWSVVSEKAAEKLNLELIKAYHELSNEGFVRRKKMMAYAFLYYLETGKKNTAYRFSFDDRDGDSGIYYRESISFNGPNEEKEAEEVGVCGYFRFSDIEMEEKNLEEDGIVSKILCAGRKGMAAILTEKDDSKTVLEIRTGISNYVTMETADLDIDFNEKEVEIDYKNNGYPKVYIDMKKRSEEDEAGEKVFLKNSISEMTVKVDYRRFSFADKFKKLKCREIKPFEFE